MNILDKLCAEFSLRRDYTENIIGLIDDGNTIPFIARYRKEMHGACDDQVLRQIADRLQYLRNLSQKQEDVAAAIIEQGKMTDEIQASINAAETLAALEDVYRPFKQKRRTRATIAKERGLEPLALALLSPENKSVPETLAKAYVDPEKDVPDVDAALAGANDIAAEIMSDSPELRRDLKTLIRKRGLLVSEGKTEEETVYDQYKNYGEALEKIPGHRILALNRGEKEGKLKVGVQIDEQDAMFAFDWHFLKNKNNPAVPFIKAAEHDSYNRLVFPSVEREIRSALTEQAQEQAIKVFGQNLKPLLLQPPIKGKTVLAVDPAYRTGCKLAVVDPNGKVLATDVIYPTPPQNKTEESAKKLKKLIDRCHVDCISIGNGTAGREAEQFVADVIRDYGGKVTYAVVNEAGASVYSASKLAAKEFPNYDLTLRSAVSIARRLQDPLSELVKIDPKSIGVGQYQHDLPQARLDECLTGVVEDCVNAVGVDLNTASPSILRYVAGISSAVAENVVAYRDEHGAFASRAELKKVKGLGPKAYEQCAGFLRIPGGEEPLDNTGVHPESYAAAGTLLKLVGKESDNLSVGVPDLPIRLKAYGVQKAASDCGVGVPTLNDIALELAKPGRDLRDALPKPILRGDVLHMEDLKEGMTMKGTVRNVTDFGAFVDIGVHQDGLVHISQLTDRYVKHPSEVVKVGDIVNVKVLSVDVGKKRIALTMKEMN